MERERDGEKMEIERESNRNSEMGERQRMRE